MGQDSSTPNKPKQAAPAQRTTHAAAPVDLQPLRIEKPTIYNTSGEETQPLLLTKQLSCALIDALPVSCLSGGAYTKQKWVLLYNSATRGKSFQTLVQSITKKGPVIIVVKVANSDCIIGGFCGSDWLTVSEREKEAVSRSAAAQRAARTGYGSAAPSAPAGQHNVFFGSDECFVFRCNAADGPTIYKSRPSMNTNFMYLFDTHPLEDKIGIGMGGQPGYFGWFLDRWLETGTCFGAQCTTFGNPRLSPTESWTVEGVEAYAVSRDAVANLTSGSAAHNTKASVLDKNNTETTTNKFMLETYGIHKFDQNERPNV